MPTVRQSCTIEDDRHDILFITNFWIQKARWPPICAVTPDDCYSDHIILPITYLPLNESTHACALQSGVVKQIVQADVLGIGDSLFFSFTITVGECIDIVVGSMFDTIYRLPYGRSAFI